jgi:hypothetical protein
MTELCNPAYRPPAPSRRVSPPSPTTPHLTTTTTTMAAASTTTHTAASARRLIFSSVFPTNTASVSSAPAATPLRHSTRLHPGPPVSLFPTPTTSLPRAWQLATQWLKFPEAGLPGTLREWILLRGEGDRGREAAREAIAYLLEEQGERLREWYVGEVRRHFLAWVRKECQIPAVSTPGGEWGRRRR